jgi:cation:H+ antiporter
MIARKLLPLGLALAASVPGVAVRLAGIHLEAPVQALVSGIAIFGAAFVLVWACDTAQADISQALALAVVALLAVLPEYAVDMYFTWQAGTNPAGDYASYAIANMTGANRLLIGVAWVAVALVCWAKTRQPVRLERDRRTELFFLALATAYALVIPLKGSLAWYDGIVFVGIYAWYMVQAAKRPVEASEAYGPAAALVKLPPGRRRLVTAALFLIAAGVILANAAPFSESLIQSGEIFGVNKFLLVQWLAPIASEAPEFIVALMLAFTGRAALGLGSLLSAKVNQWTLLVGMIPAVCALAHKSLAHPIPMGHFQMDEILLTAAQSVLAVVILASLRLSVPQGLLLFGLFVAQLVAPAVSGLLPGDELFGIAADQLRQFFAVLYFVTAAALVLDSPHRIRNIWAGRKADWGLPGAVGGQV